MAPSPPPRHDRPSTPIPRPARAVLALAATLVPRSRRSDWLREWRGELAHRAHRDAGRLRLLGRSLGSVHDAFWIRTHQWSPDMLLQDLRFAIRAHTKRPGFSLIAILTLALGIGATTAMFSLVNGVLLETLPYPEADRLVRLFGTNEARGLTRSNMNPLDLLDVRERADGIEELAYETRGSMTLMADGEASRVGVSFVHSSYFDALGVRPAAGRWFLPEENLAERSDVVVLSEALWQRLSGGDPGIVGTTIDLDGESHTVIGVAPAGFQGPFHPEPEALWRPWPYEPGESSRGGHFMRAVARLAPGASLSAVQQQIDAVYASIAEEHTKPDRGIVAVPLQEAMVGEVRPLLMTLLTAVGFVLLIVCANLAGLLLARASGRRQELAVRMALGASRGRILRQMLTETVLLGLAGGGLGIALAVVTVELVGRGFAAYLPTRPDVGVDLTVLGFALGVSVLTGLLFGLAPGLKAARRDPREEFQEGAGGALRRDRSRLRTGLIVAEVALSLILLAGAGLMLRSFVNLLGVETGYDPASVVTVRLSVPETDYPTHAEAVEFYDTLRRRLTSLPGVQTVGAINRLPLGGSQSCDGFHLEGWPPPEPGRWECAEERVVGGDYFEAMGIDLLQGRRFDESDHADSAPVVVVSRTMAERYMADGEVLGRGFKWGLPDEEPYRRVVGVVEDVKHAGLDADPMPEVYMPQAQYPYYRTMYLAARTDGSEPEAIFASVRDAVRQLDPTIPLFDVMTMQDRLGEALLGHRFALTVLGVFAVAALVLACLGLYGVLAYAVSQRHREIGVRMALGARGADVTAMVLRRGVGLAAAGLLVGAAGWWLLSGALQGLLYGVQPGDPVTLGGMVVLLLVLAGLASYMPARRATKVDPVRALRS